MSLQKTLELKFDIDKLERKLITLGIGLTILLLCLKADGNYTKIAYRNKSAEDCPDSPRYKALGNSVAVPVLHWIGHRLDQYLTEVKEIKR